MLFEDKYHHKYFVNIQFLQQNLANPKKLVITFPQFLHISQYLAQQIVKLINFLLLPVLITRLNTLLRYFVNQLLHLHHIQQPPRRTMTFNQATQRCYPTILQVKSLLLDAFKNEDVDQK